MDYKPLIRNWHIKASDEDYFSKFVFEYLAFIAFLQKVQFRDAEDDRNSIQMLKRDETIKNMYLEIINTNSDVREAWQKIIAELNKAGLAKVKRNGEVGEIGYWNCSQDKVEFKSAADKAKVSGKIHSFEDWENIVEFWYSIRNNLFHGGKNPQDQRDQLLVENAYKTLQPLMTVFIQNGL